MELMAVIVVIAIVISVAAASINGASKSARQKTSEEMRGNLKDAAIMYVLDSKEIHLKKCDDNFSETDSSTWGNCAESIDVGKIISEGLFEDTKGYCSGSSVVVYRDESGYNAYVSDAACTNY